MMSQVIGLMVWQVCPVGQQRTVVFAASGMHALFDGQQKSEGRPACGHPAYVGSPQVEARSKMLEFDVAVTEVARQTASSALCLDLLIVFPDPNDIDFVRCSSRDSRLELP